MTVEQEKYTQLIMGMTLDLQLGKIDLELYLSNLKFAMEGLERLTEKTTES